MNVAQLVERLQKASDAYYNSGVPSESDAEFDRLVDVLRKKDPQNPFLQTVGAPPSALFTKVKHAIPMGSLDKVKDEDELCKWLAKCGNRRILIQWKFDGCSLSLKYVDGRLVGAVSRGDGLYGESVFQNVLKSNHIPKRVSGFTGYVRGEAVLRRDDFVTFFPGGSNPRNVGNGALRNKHGEGCEHLRFYAYDRLCGGESCSDTEMGNQRLLMGDGFDGDLGEYAETIEQVMEIYQRRGEERSSLPFEVDGLVLRVDDVAFQQSLGVHDGRPKGMMAIKWTSPQAESTLREIVVSVGHTGALIPTGRIDPVQIAGVTVTNVLLNNYDEIQRLGLVIGCKVLVERAGEVIPKCLGRTDVKYKCSCCNFVGNLTEQVSKHS